MRSFRVKIHIFFIFKIVRWNQVGILFWKKKVLCSVFLARRTKERERGRKERERARGKNGSFQVLLEA